MQLFIAEKPELARAIVEAFGGGKRENGYYLCGSDTVTWCFGHMLELLEPGEYDARYENWKLDDLPFSFIPWKKKPTSKGEKQLKKILALLKKAESVVHAGDPDAEGQLLVDEIIAYAKYSKSVQRALINDNSLCAVKKSLGNLRDNAEFSGLSAAAEARQVGDQLYGFNMTRLYTLTAKQQGYTGGTLSVGRVQTPVLGLIVRRDRENADHKKAYFYTITGEFHVEDKTFPAFYIPSESDNTDEKKRLTDYAQAKEIADSACRQIAVIQEVTTDKKTIPAPLPYNLLKLQTDAARLHRMKPDYVKSITQTLREKHRLITYNRSDCQYLPEEHHAEAPVVLAAICKTCPEFADISSKADPAVKGRAFNSGKVTAHHAIIPTASVADFDNLSKDERIIYTLISRAYIAQFFPPYEYEQTCVLLQVSDHKFCCRTHVPLSQGWKVLYKYDDKATTSKADNDNDLSQSLKNLCDDQNGVCETAGINKGETKPKAIYTMPTLLTDLTRVAQYIRDERLRKLLISKDRKKSGEHGGIGTPATRDTIISTLFERGFITEKRNGKSTHIISTDAGREFYDTLPEQAKFPDMSALWHEQQQEIESGKLDIKRFITGLVSFINNEVDRVKTDGLDLKIDFHACLKCAKALLCRSAGKDVFWGCSGYPDCRTTFPDKNGKPDMQAKNAKVKPMTSELHLCLECGKGLIRRKSKKGNNYWWGCSGYPNCKSCYMDIDGKPDYHPQVQNNKKCSNRKTA